MADSKSSNRFLTLHGKLGPHYSCDFCRQRKIRCDGRNMPDSGSCSNCASSGRPCTYLIPYRKRGRKNSYVEELKQEIASLKAKLRKVSVCSLCAQPLQSQPEGDVASSVFQHSSPESDVSTSVVEGEPVDGQDFTADELAARFQSFSLERMKVKYWGAASVFALANSAIAAKDKFMGQPTLRTSRRSSFWEVLPWERKAYTKTPHYTYPETDLIQSLLHHYFLNVQPFVPVLHRYSFERSVADGLHLTDHQFGGLLLAVLAVASRYSDDPRIFINNDPLLVHSAGWNFAKQVLFPRSLFEPSIYEVQMYCVLIFYALGLSEPQPAWMYLGIGIRLLQQRGEHRRKEDQKWTPTDELGKRVFWSFVVMDRFLSAFFGRPAGLQPEEQDIEFPLEVDDEYWEQDKAVQPPSKPSQLSYFNCSLKIHEISVDVMRRLYGSKKWKLLMGWDGPDWEMRTVGELDSAVNNILNSIPPHLRWDPENPPRGIFFDQAAALLIMCNYTRIAIHRQYIQKVTTLAPPSLSICANAARTIIRTADSWLHKQQRLPGPMVLNPVFVSGIVLVLNLFATKRAGNPLDTQSKDLPLVAAAIEILKFAEIRLQPLGRLRELLQEIWSLDGSLPQPDSEQPTPVAEGTSTTAPEPAAMQSTGTPLVWTAPEHGDFSRTSSTQSLPESGLSTPHTRSALNTPPSYSPIPLGTPAEHLVVADTSNTTTPDSHMWDDELMSMWMAAPTSTHVANINHWDAYLDKRNGGDANWSTTFGTQRQ
ncbi:fungal-specific transcription factor domain-containing protein [Mycena sanguinolenta]|nr:fungal-specific transcription factor domain-containing protein [Mycena sanguinolenta]